MRKTFLLVATMVLLAGMVTDAYARFVSTDPVQANTNNGQNFNRYQYANSNPYGFTDPDGRQSRDFEYISRQAGTYLNPPPQSSKDWLGPAIGVGLGGVLAAPVAGFAGSAALANPATANSLATAAADIAMGDAIGGASLAAGGTTIYRVVDSMEMSSITKTGSFMPPPNGDSVKRFLGNLPDAKALAQKFSQVFGGEQRVVQGVAPQKVMDASSVTRFSDVPGRPMDSINVPVEHLPNIQCKGAVDGC